jgi:hypothetical protein
MPEAILQGSYEITSGFNRCMDCGCEKFKEGYTPNYCVCGHSYISHRFYENYHPQLCSYNLEARVLVACRANNQQLKS